MGTNNTDSNEPINPAMADALQRAAEQNNAKTIKQDKEDMKNSSNNKPRKKRKTHLERANDAIAALIECTTYKEAYDIVTKEGKYIESKRPDARETVNQLLATLREDVKHDIIEDDSVKSDKPNNSGKKTMKKQENAESSNDKADNVTKDQAKDQTGDTTDTIETVVGEDVTEETVINTEDAFKQAENGENIEDAVIENVVEPTEEDVVTEPTKVTSIDLPIEDFLFPSLKLDVKSDTKADESNDTEINEADESDETKKSKKVKKVKEVAKPSIVDFVKSDTTFVNNNSRKDTFSYIAVSLINKCSLLVSGNLTAIVHRFV